MSSLKVLAIAGAVAAGAASFAQAGDLTAPPPPPIYDAPLRGTVGGGGGGGLYLRGDIGVGVQSVRNYSQDEVTGPNDRFLQKESTSNVAFGGVGVGYKFNNWFRFDVTGELRSTQGFGTHDYIDRRDPGFVRPPVDTNAFRYLDQSNTYRGNLSSVVGLANAYVDLGTFCTLGCLTPFLGAGVGVASHTVSGFTDNGIVRGEFYQGATRDVIPSIEATLGKSSSKTKTNFAWALMAGVGYQVTPNVTLEVGYRYLNMGKMESGRIENVFEAGESYKPLKAKTIDSHDIRIGMRWALNSDCCSGPAPAPEPVFAPAPMIRKF